MKLPKPYFERDGISIYHGDNREILPQIEAGSIDLVVTSPPYNLKSLKNSGMKGKRNRGAWVNAGLRDGYSEHADDLPEEEYIAWQRFCLSECLRTLAETGAIFYNHKWRVEEGNLNDRSEIVSGFPLRQIIIWERDGGINFSESFFLPTYEVIYLFAKPQFRIKMSACLQKDVWRFSQDYKNPHPAPFPLGLPLRCINATHAKVILDPFMGSGTTLRAAKDSNRKAIGIDNSEAYCEMAAKRLSQEVFCYEAA